MSKSTITRIILAAVGIVLVIFLYSLPKYVVKNDDEVGEVGASENEPNKNGHDLSEIKVSNEAQIRINKLRSSYNSTEDREKKLIFADSLVNAYIGTYLLDSAESYLKEMLTIGGEPVMSVVIAEYYLKMHKVAQGSSKEKSLSYGEKAIAYSDQVLKQNPENLQAQVIKGEAIVYVNVAKGRPPVEGLMLLKQLIEAHPEFVQARLALGSFYLQRGQIQPEWLEKGIVQFESILEYDSQNINALIYLLDSYALKQDKDKMRLYLNKLSKIATEDDPFLKEYIEKWQKELN